MSSDEERLEEMLKAVMEEENKRAAAQNTKNIADEEELPAEDFGEELPKLPAEDFEEELPELPAEDFEEELPELPAEDFEEELPELPAEDFEEELPELPAEDFEEELPELPAEGFGEELPELPAEDFEEELPELPAEDFGEELPELPAEDFEEELPELPAEDFEEELPELPAEDFGEELPELPAEDLEEEIPERHFERKQVSPAKEMAVDPLKLLAMSEEEVDKVLEEEAALGEMFTGKMKGEERPAPSEEKDALSDIQEMLQMSDDHVLVDESGMGKDIPLRKGEPEPEEEQGFFGEVSGQEEEIRQEAESGKKKKERKRKKERKKAENGEEKEKPGKKFAALFFGGDDDELEEEAVKEKRKGKSADAGDGGEVKEKKKEKKEKKKKPPKKEKEKNPAKAAKEKLQREKKAEKAKIKAAKAEKAEKERRAAKKLPKKRVIVWTLLCASIGAGILLINSIGMEAIQITEARNAYEDKDFETAYRLLNGRELSEEDQLIFSQSSAVLHLKHAREAYENHLKLKKPVKALEDLLKGVEKYQGLLQAGESELITPELTAEYQSVLDILQEQYALSETGALEINEIEGDYEYTLQLEALVNGEIYQSPSEIVKEEEEAAQAFPELEDLLPEEEEYLDGSGD